MPQVPLKHDWREGLGSPEILLQADFFLAFHTYWLRGGSLALSRLTATAARLGFVLASPSGSSSSPRAPAEEARARLLHREIRNAVGLCVRSDLPASYQHLRFVSADTEESKAPHTPSGHLQERNAAPLLAASVHRASCSNFGWAEDLFCKHMLCCKFSHTFQLWELWKHFPSQPELSCPSFWI